MIVLHRFIEIFLFPPGSVLLLGGLGFLTVRYSRSVGRFLIGAALLMLWAFSTPLVSFAMLDALQNRFPPLTDIPPQADAIVVLGGGREFGANEFGREQDLTLHAAARVRYAAWLASKTGLPVIASGGAFGKWPGSEAELAEEILRNEYGVAKVIAESRSQTTRENARFTGEILEANDWKHPLVVTESWHMPRSIFSFNLVGIEAIAAPTATDTPGVFDHGVWAVLPQASAMERSRIALHEWVGQIWYWLRS